MYSTYQFQIIPQDTNGLLITVCLTNRSRNAGAGRTLAPDWPQGIQQLS